MMPKSIIQRIASRVLVRVVNGASSLLADDPFSRRVRKLVYRALNCRIGRGTVINGGGYINGWNVTIGADAFLNRGCFFDLNDTVTIGDRVFVANHVHFITTNHEIGHHHQRAGKIVSAPIVVEDGVWIGANALILPGVRIGAGSVVAAGAVVAQDVAPDTLVGGVPARLIRKL